MCELKRPNFVDALKKYTTVFGDKMPESSEQVKKQNEFLNKIKKNIEAKGIKKHQLDAYVKKYAHEVFGENAEMFGHLIERCALIDLHEAYYSSVKAYEIGRCKQAQSLKS